MNKLKILFIIVFITFLSGCTITYNLDISPNGYKESVDIYYRTQDDIIEYALPIYYGEIGYEDVDADFINKQEDIEYYNSKIYTNEELPRVNYNYKFDEKSIENSNFINSAFDIVEIKEYNEDDNQYRIITTDKSITLFNKFDEIENIKVNIISNYKVISNNADSINKNVYTWYFDKNSKKSINLIYNPNEVVDYRTFIEKILDGDYLTPFTLITLVLIIGLIIYIFIKNKENKINKI